MNRSTMIWAVGLMLIFGSMSVAQNSGEKGRKRQRGKQKQRDTSARSDKKANSADQGIGTENTLAIGESGVAWYTTWATGLAEAKRSNRPIFFMSAATTCGGVPGVF